MPLSLTLRAVCVAKAWVCGATGTLTALPWQDVLAPGQLAELVSCLAFALEKAPVPSHLQESPRPDSGWQKLLKNLESCLPAGLGA